MKNFRDIFTAIKIPFIVVITGSIILLLGVVLLIVPLRSTSLSNSSKIAKLHAQEAGAVLSMKINSSANIVRNYSYLIAHLVSTDLIPKENKRQFMLSEMEIRNKNEKALNNLWCTFEPDALDGMDAFYINTSGSNELGIFEPWFEQGKLATSPTDDFSSIYYTIPKETKHEAVTEPYWDSVNGKNTLMISFSAPILLNNEFLGVVGTDFYIEDLSELVATEKIVGNGILVTDKGVIVIHDDPELIGTSVNYNHNDVTNRLATAKMFDKFYKTDKGDIYTVYVPVRFGGLCMPWVYIVEVPARQIYAEARKTVALLAIIIILLGVSIYFYVKTVEKNRQLKELHTVKDKLFSVVAHDLRGPIGAMMSLLKLTSLKKMDVETQEQILKELSKRTDDVFGLLDNLLRWAKNQMKGMVVAPVRFDVQTETGAVTDTLRDVAAEKQITLRSHIESQEVYADRDMFSVVVRNLTTNALKYTSAGGEITINSELSDNMLIVSVNDTGTGMSPEVQNKLFKLSETKSQRGTNNESGTGLGLVLCADFVKANGGRIWFASKPNEGSTFYFSVPLSD